MHFKESIQRDEQIKYEVYFLRHFGINGVLQAPF